MPSPAIDLLIRVTAEIRSHFGRKCLFRGQADDLPLIPKVGRPEYRVINSRGAPLQDLARFLQWKIEARRLIADMHLHSDWDLYAMAQHHGLATRLLDWSSNPMVAMYFACMGSPRADGVVIAWNPSGQRIPSIDHSVDIAEHTDVAIFEPSPVNSRFIAQHGLFTYHPDPTAPFFNPNGMAKIAVGAADKNNILLDLRKYGMSTDRLFPDLDGLSQDVNFTTRNARTIVEDGMC